MDNLDPIGKTFQGTPGVGKSCEVVCSIPQA